MSEEEKHWKVILREYWLKILPFVLVIIGAFISGLYVFLFYNETGGFWSYTLNDWSFGRMVGYVFWLIIWELLLVALPTLGVLGIIFAAVWFTLPQEKRDELKAMSKKEEEKEKKRRLDSKGKKAGAGGGGGTGLVTIVFLIIMAVNGKWETLFANMDLHYFVATYLWAMLWIAVVCGIPAIIFGIYYLRKILK